MGPEDQASMDNIIDLDPLNLDCKILVAEPRDALRNAIVGTLEQLGFKTVRQARNGTEAWAILNQRQVNLLLADWNMPEISGLPLLKVIRTDSRLDCLPVILVCDRVTKSQVVEAGEAGVSEILLLPLNGAKLKSKLEQAMLTGRDPQYLEAEKHYRRGMELMKKQQYAIALEEFRRILEVYESAEVYYNMGYICTAQNRLEQALGYFRKATSINQAYARAHRRMGELYVKLGRKKLAEESFQQAAEIYLEKQMDDYAELVLNEVVKLNPDTINVYNTLGIIYRQRGHYDKALAQYRKALKVHPDNESIYYNMGRIFFDTKRFAEAERILAKSLEINPDFNDGRELLNSVRSSMGKAES
jgi:tetratricopeptide (TPR) repeat protein